MPQARPYQSALKAAIEDVWRKGGTPLAVSPTGSGKTFVMAQLFADHDGAAVAIAHRRELVGQISLALARAGVLHRIIAPERTVMDIVAINRRELGGNPYYWSNAPIAVASVDSIKRSSKPWRESVTMWTLDEGHHLLEDNKWGRAVKMFPNAKGLGVTATPKRTDGKGLGKHADGFFTDLVEGPGMRDLIEEGYLSDYKVYAPPSALDVSKLRVSTATGDYIRKDMQTAVAKASITGDVVAHYLKWGGGKLGVTFAVSVAEAEILAEAYRAAGVPAAVVTAKTPPGERVETIRAFANRQLLQLVNVDIFGEGFDLPAIEVVSFARPTKSWALFVQAFGRGLRPLPGKDHAIIIDHVGNVLEHGLPDAPQTHSLDRRPRRKESSNQGPDAVRMCKQCAGVYRRIFVTCPYCGFVPVPSERSAPEQVDGDLIELDRDVLEAMRQAVKRVDMPADEYARELFSRFCPPAGIHANVKRHEATQEAQKRLRNAVAWWRGVKEQEGLSERECYRLFFLTFGIDVLSAYALPAKEAEALCSKIRNNLPYVGRCLT